MNLHSTFQQNNYSLFISIVGNILLLFVDNFLSYFLSFSPCEKNWHYSEITSILTSLLIFFIFLSFVRFVLNFIKFLVNFLNYTNIFFIINILLFFLTRFFWFSVALSQRIFLLFVWDRLLWHSIGWPETCCVDQNGLELPSARVKGSIQHYTQLIMLILKYFLISSLVFFFYVFLYLLIISFMFSPSYFLLLILDWKFNVKHRVLKSKLLVRNFGFLVVKVNRLMGFTTLICWSLSPW